MFDTWDNEVDWQSQPPELVKSLYDVINAYTDKHNSISSLNSTINEELRAIYNQHITNADRLAKEIFFLDLLIRVLPLLNNEDLKLWLQTYLRPALDSAGFDLEFVKKCQEFIQVLTNDSFGSADACLVHSRGELTDFIMDRVLQVYIAKTQNVYVLIGCHFPEEERSTQIHTERIRFLERNCALMIEDWCSRRPKLCLNLINKFFLDPECRLKTLVMLTILTSSKKAQVNCVIDTPLFGNLLKSLAYDTSEAILGSDLGILIMIMGKACEKLTPYLSDLLVIFSRLLLWNTNRINDNSSMTIAKWSEVKLNSNGSLIKSQFFWEDKFNLTYFLTILYGLYPSSIIAFFQSPAQFWSKSIPSIYSTEFLTQVNTSDNLFAEISAESKSLTSRLLLHPNIVNNVNTETELKNPTAWILANSSTGTSSEEEVLLACLKLNPDTMLTLPDNLCISNGTVTGPSSTRGSINEKYDIRCAQGTNSTTNLLQLDGISSLSVEPSPTAMRARQFGYLNDRRVSIVPTKLSLEHYSSPVMAETEPREIKFLSFEFNSLKSRTNSESMDEFTIGPKHGGSIGDLFAEHEKLYSSLDTVPPNGQALMENNKESATGSFQPSDKTASNLLSKQLHADSQMETSKDNQALFSGTAIDFYQRELLIMKNEVEFTSFLKNLNKLNYVKLKTQLNRMNKEFSRKDNTYAMSPSAEETQLFEETIKEHQSKIESIIREFLIQKAQFLDKIKELKDQLRCLEGSLVELELKLSKKESTIEAIKQRLKESDDSRVSIATQLKYVLELAQLGTHPVQTPQPTLSRKDTGVSLTQVETDLAQTTTEMALLKEQLNRAIYDREKARDELAVTSTRYKNELRILKLNIGDSVREQTGHYERKIQELNRIILRFESSIDEKDAQIAQLSRPNPIQIPRPINIHSGDATYHAWGSSHHDTSGSIEPGSMPHEYDYMMKRMPSVNSLSSSSTPMASTPQQPAWPQPATPRHNSLNNIPIIKGRGGYQKRTKKIM